MLDAVGDLEIIEAVDASGEIGCRKIDCKNKAAGSWVSFTRGDEVFLCAEHKVEWGLLLAHLREYAEWWPL